MEYGFGTCSDGQVMGSDVLRSHKVVTLLPRMVVANEARGRDKGSRQWEGSSSLGTLMFGQL